jgi:hypothetical protein
VATEQPTGYHPDPVPRPSGGLPTPVSGRMRPRGPVVIAAIAGLLAGALAVGGAWLLFGNDGASSSPIAAPDRLGDYVRWSEAKPNREYEQGREHARDVADRDRRSSERLSDSHDGAGAVVQTYADDELLNLFALEVIRAPVAFPPYVPYSDPESTGFDKPFEEVRMFGEVACALRNNAPRQTYVTTCVRSGDELTVQITHISGDDLSEDPEAVANLVTAAWQELA